MGLDLFGVFLKKRAIARKAVESGDVVGAIAEHALSLTILDGHVPGGPETRSQWKMSVETVNGSIGRRGKKENE
jgi:hypothetical protein